MENYKLHLRTLVSQYYDDEYIISDVASSMMSSAFKELMEKTNLFKKVKNSKEDVVQNLLVGLMFSSVVTYEGRMLGLSLELDPPPRKPETLGFIICQNCGMILGDDNVHCVNCGVIL